MVIVARRIANAGRSRSYSLSAVKKAFTAEFAEKGRRDR